MNAAQRKSLFETCIVLLCDDAIEQFEIDKTHVTRLDCFDRKMAVATIKTLTKLTDYTKFGDTLEDIAEEFICDLVYYYLTRSELIMKWRTEFKNVKAQIVRDGTVLFETELNVNEVAKKQFKKFCDNLTK